MTVDHDTCITCGDVAVAAIVVEVDASSAVVDVGGRRERVGIELVAPVAPGERVLCHAGIALTKIEDEA